MSLNPNRAEQRRIADAAAARSRRLQRRERLAETTAGALLFAAVAVLWALSGVARSEIDVLSALACMACLAVAVHVPFAVGGGYTVPTQLAFVPLWFTLPPALIPVAVVVALLVARVPAVLARERRASRLLLVPADAWFSLGPAVVLAVAGEHVTPVVLAAAIAAQVLTEIAAWAGRERLLGTWGGLRPQLGELWIHGVDLALTPVAIVVAFAVERHPVAALALIPLLGVLATFSREREARMASLTELNQAYRGTALVLGDVVDADDGYTGEHSRGVVALAVQVGDRLGLDAERLRDLEFGALLHDIGKVAIPKAIINKPGKLDPAEWRIIKTHTIEGQRMLDRVGGFMGEVGLIVRSHHERWDGRGYPDGLSGEAIPLEARIISCCDAWNAMTTTRSYRAAMPFEAAVAELRRHSGTQFDPRVADAVLAAVAPHAVATTALAA